MSKGRGRPPKPGHLRLVDGTHRDDRHGDRKAVQRAAEATRRTFGPLQRPSYLKGPARQFWNDYIAPADWLDGSRAAAAIALCELWAEFVSNPPGFKSARHAQLRAYMSELGLTDERRRPAKPREDDDDLFA